MSQMLSRFASRVARFWAPMLLVLASLFALPETGNAERISTQDGRVIEAPNFDRALWQAFGTNRFDQIVGNLVMVITITGTPKTYLFQVIGMEITSTNDGRYVDLFVPTGSKFRGSPIDQLSYCQNKENPHIGSWYVVLERSRREEIYLSRVVK